MLDVFATNGSDDEGDLSTEDGEVNQSLTEELERTEVMRHVINQRTNEWVNSGSISPDVMVDELCENTPHENLYEILKQPQVKNDHKFFI